MPTFKKQTILFIGGARSGKSSFALGEASKIKGKKAYIASAEAFDEEMKERIMMHKKERGKEWDTFEEPLRIAGVVKGVINDYKVVIIDCLTLWLSNVMHGNLNAENEIENLVDCLRSTHHVSQIFIISNEVGMGIVPANELARQFRDLAGILNRKVAAIADRVYLITAGIPVRIK